MSISDGILELSWSIYLLPTLWLWLWLRWKFLLYSHFLVSIETEYAQKFTLTIK